MRASREALILVAACAVLYLTGAADIPFYTRGEPREGLVVQEMVRTGEWLVPARPDGEPARKPPLYYWAAALALRALPESPELALRLPSAVLATAAVLGTWAVGRATCGAAAGLPAGLVLATAFEWTRAASSARVDMALGASLTAVLAGWMLALARGAPGWAALAVAGALLGTLAKGPVALVLPGLAVAGLAFARRELATARALRPLLVLGVAAAGAGIWYAAAYARTGPAILDVVQRENWLRFLGAEGGERGHAHTVAYLLPLGLVGLMPWTPLIPLALVPFAPRPRPAAIALAGAWVITGFVFFSLAASKRSVYLSPLYPAIALLLGAGVAAPPEGGRLARATALGAALYAPGLLGLAAIAGALGTGLDVGALVRPWLKPADQAGAEALAAAARAAAPELCFLALATAAAAGFVAHAARRTNWRRVVVAVALVAVAWTAAFNGLLHPAIARDRSVKSFLAGVGRTLPPDAPLYALFPPDPGVRFYAPRPLERRSPTNPPGGRLLLWEDEWRQLRDREGRPLTVLAVSDARQPKRGRLALVEGVAGPLRPVPESAGPPAPPGLRTGSPPR